MKYLCSLCVFFLCGFLVVEAYELTITETTEPYAVVPLSDAPEIKQAFLGTLQDFPIMYETTSAEPFTLTVQLAQRATAEPDKFSLMIVRQNDTDGGVTEIDRLPFSADEWQARKDSVYGMTFLESPVVTALVEPGTYRVEVSTPENAGQYRLTFGAGEVETGYFATLGNVRTTQKFFGQSVANMLLSSYVYYLLGIIILLIVLQRTWKYRKSIAHGA